MDNCSQDKIPVFSFKQSIFTTTIFVQVYFKTLWPLLFKTYASVCHIKVIPPYILVRELDLHVLRATLH